jgi:hypothetical protein
MLLGGIWKSYPSNYYRGWPTSLFKYFKKPPGLVPGFEE